jgi:hypothetical protein
MGQAQPAPEAQMLHNGDLWIQLDPENRQIILFIAEDKKAQPIVFDLKKNLIYNASFPVAEVINIQDAPA